MNWLELELIAFGPFAGQTLDFSKSCLLYTSPSPRD